MGSIKIMSSLQKFHRRTQSVGPTTAIGSELRSGAGFWLGTAGDGISKMYVAPKSSEVQKAWGSQGTSRGTVSTTNGLANTNTLAGFGEAAHPAAYHCKNLTHGGYNTWYLPAVNELITCYSNKSATPFANADGFVVTSGPYPYWSSTEVGNYARAMYMENGAYYVRLKSNGGYNVRAVRRVV